MDNVLLKYQQKWIEDTTAVKICEKSRRIGLTWAEACSAVLTASSNKGQDIWYVGYNRDMAREFILDASEWAKSLNLAAQAVEEVVLKNPDKDILAFQIKCGSGYRITALSSRPSNLRGKDGRVIIDEAAFHDDLPGLLKAGMAFLMWGGSMSIISSHNGEDSYFNEIIKDSRAGRLPYSIHRVTLDDAIADGLFQRICLKAGKQWSQSTEDKWKKDLIDYYKDNSDEELFCIPSQSGQSYLPRVLVESCMKQNIPVIRIKRDNSFTLLPETRRKLDIDEWLKSHIYPLIEHCHPSFKTYFGMDFARSGDLSILVVAQESQDLIREVAFSIEMKNIPFDQQKQILFEICDRLPRFTSGSIDARGNGEYLGETLVQRYRHRIQAIKPTESFYVEWFPKYKAALEDKKIVLPMDVDILQDHRMVVLNRGVPKIQDIRSRGRDGNQRHGDSAIACLMLWQASCQDVGIIDPDFMSDQDIGWDDIFPNGGFVL